MKHSIFRKFAILSVLALIVGTALSFYLSREYNIRDATQNCRSTATIAVEEAQTLLKNSTCQQILSSYSDEEYDDLREDLRSVCRHLKLTYLYMYEVNDTHTERTYLFCMAADDKADKKVSKIYPRGDKTPVDVLPFSEQELQALSTNALSDEETTDNELGFNLTWYSPIKIAGQKNTILIGTDINGTSVRDSIFDNTLAFAIPMCAIILGVLAIQVAFLKKSVADPLLVVSKRMRCFTDGNMGESEPIQLGNKDEIAEIANSFNQMSNDIREYITYISHMTEERVAASTELAVARNIQQGLVPPTKRLEGDTYDVLAFMRTARAVGGDFYDLDLLEDGRLLLVLADVSGKGISAALFMAMSRTLIRDRLQLFCDPATALNDANDIIEANNPENMFVTMIAGIFDASNGTLVYANAGHTAPLVVGRGYEHPDPGIALGLFEDAGIVNNTIHLAPGEGILLYTDGATEAVNTDSQFFGEEHLAQAVAQAQGATEAVEAAVNAVDDFAKGCEQFDDLTLLSLFARDEKSHD